MTIQLPVYGIIITLGPENPDFADTYLGGTITSDLHEKGESAFNSAIDGIESMILACACAGLDVESAAFLEAIETAVEAADNNVD